MDFDTYSQYDAVGLAELVASGGTTAAELLAAARARAKAVNPRINAIVRFMDAEADARAAEPLSGPFAGVPFLLKDLFQDYAGVPTSQGSRAMRDWPAAHNATVVDRWLDAGVVVFGKTNSPEFGAKGITEPDVWGPTRNPWDVARTPGGSSGGSAAAVAAGIVPCAAASDGGGSIRIPAACCGLFGLKPGRGLVPAGPDAGEGLYGAALNGVVSRSVRDTAAMLDVLAGPEPTSPYLPAMPERPLAQEVGVDPGKLRIGVLTSTHLAPKLHPEVQAGVDATVRELKALGHDVELLSTAPFDDVQLAKDFLTIWFVAQAQGVDAVKRITGATDEGFEQDTLLTAAFGRATDVIAHADALENRHAHVQRLAEFHASFDLLLTPTLSTLQPKVGSFAQPRALEKVADVLLKTRSAGLLVKTPVLQSIIERNLKWVPYTQLANLTGRPAMSVPLQQTPGGLPIGIQFVAPLGGEALLLRLASQLEAAHPWADRRPAL